MIKEFRRLRLFHLYPYARNGMTLICPDLCVILIERIAPLFIL